MTTELDTDLTALGGTLRATTVRVFDDRAHGSGSGVVWDSEGAIVTNAHVVRGASARVFWEDGRSERAEVERRDDALDLTVLRVVAASGLAVAPTRVSATLRPGELVVAVGNPLGLVGALTAGLVQRCNSRWVVSDVRLAPGNSGGPLADTAGRVVGINSMVAGALGYAVASDAVAAFVGTHDARPKLGIGVTPARATLDGRRTRVLVVTAIEPGSVAERAGLVLGDAILRSALHELEIFRAGTRMTIALPWTADPEKTRAA